MTFKKFIHILPCYSLIINRFFTFSTKCTGILYHNSILGNRSSSFTESEPECTDKCVAGFTEDHVQMPVIYKVYWLVHTLAVVIAIGVTGSYFVVDYNPGKE
jgi:hypothetical protein